jgi:hypothetical protein
MAAGRKGFEPARPSKARPSSVPSLAAVMGAVVGLGAVALGWRETHRVRERNACQMTYSQPR